MGGGKKPGFLEKPGFWGAGTTYLEMALKRNNVHGAIAFQLLYTERAIGPILNSQFYKQVATKTSPARFEFPIAKAQYLLNRAAEPGEGGDKRKFWREVMGFDSLEAIREAILAAVTIDMLQPQSQNAQGELYRAYIQLTGPSGLSRRIRTVWIVLFNEDVARFVTAVPDRLGGLQ